MSLEAQVPWVATCARADLKKKKTNKSIFLSPKCYGSLVWLKKYINSDSSWSSSKKGTMKDTRYITIKLPPESGSDCYFFINFTFFSVGVYIFLILFLASYKRFSNQTFTLPENWREYKTRLGSEFS